MRIAICDDNKAYIDVLKKLVLDYGIRNDIKIEVIGYCGGLELICSESTYDVVLLDIDLPDIDGIEVAERLRNMHIYSDIIMVTGIENRFRDAFYVRANDYLIKPVSFSDLSSALDRVRERQMQNNVYNGERDKEIEVYNHRKKYHIKQKDVDYVKAYNGYVLIYSQGIEYRVDKTLVEYMEYLDKELFCQVSRGIVVNLLKAYMNLSDKSKVTVEGQEFKISRRCKNNFIKAYIEKDLKDIKVK